MRIIVLFSLLALSLSAELTKTKIEEITIEFQEPIQNEIEELTSKTLTNKKIMSDKGLNYLLTEKLSFLLSGSSDINLFNNYFLIDNTDGRVYLGHNFMTNEENYNSLASFGIGLETNVSENVAQVFDGDLSQNTGLRVNLNLINKIKYLTTGSINYDLNFRKKSIEIHKHVKNEIKTKFADRIEKLNKGTSKN